MCDFVHSKEYLDQNILKPNAEKTQRFWLGTRRQLTNLTYSSCRRRHSCAALC